MKKRVLAVITSMLIIFSATGSAFAAVDLFRDDGTITLVLETEGDSGETSPLVGIKMSIYRVADIMPFGEGYVFALSGDFVDSEADLDIEDAGSHREQAELLSAFAKDRSLVPIREEQESNAIGRLAFTGLSAGLYLAMQSENSSASIGSQHNTSDYVISPTLISLPDTGQPDPWNVMARPKSEPQLPPTPPPPYDSETASVIIDGDKRVYGIEGEEIPDREFIFHAEQVDGLGASEFTGSENPLMGSATISGAGVFAIAISGLKAEESPYFFQVFEDLSGDLDDGWVYSKSIYWVEVSVTTGVGGAVMASVTARVNTEGYVLSISFTNLYGIIISCEVDKDTIKRTSAAYVSLPGMEGFDNVGKTDEMYRYDIDFRNTSNVDVDEFVVDDPLENVRLNQILVEALWTPIVWGDEDGLFNVWYKTNRTDDNMVYSNESANPNVRNPSFPNTGFKLWAKDLNTMVRSGLSVQDLNLEPGESITTIRFEYGAVKVGFTSMNYAKTSINGEHRSVSKGSINLRANNADIYQETAPPSALNVINSIFGDVVDWTPNASRPDYAEGAANAEGLLPISYLVSAAKPMYEEDIVSSAISRAALRGLRDWDQDAVVTRLISTFAGEAGGYMPDDAEVTSSFIDNAERIGWNIRDGGSAPLFDFFELEIPLSSLEIIDSGPGLPDDGGENGGNRNDGSGAPPRTGDTTVLWLWIALSAASALSIVVLILTRPTHAKKSEKQTKPEIRKAAFSLALTIALSAFFPLFAGKTALAAPYAEDTQDAPGTIEYFTESELTDNISIEYLYTELDELIIPQTIEAFGGTFSLVGVSQPQLEAMLPVTRTYSFRVDGAVNHRDMHLFNGEEDLVMTPVTANLERNVDRVEVIENLPNNDVDALPQSAMFQVTSAFAPEGTALAELRRAGVSFEVVERDEYDLPSLYRATIVYRGTETFYGVAYYEAHLTYTRSEVIREVPRFVVVAEYEPLERGGTTTRITFTETEADLALAERPDYGFDEFDFELISEEYEETEEMMQDFDGQEQDESIDETFAFLSREASFPSKEEVLEELRDMGVPLLQIGNQEIPIMSGGNPFVWALMNLLVSILGLVLAVAIVIRILAQFMRERKAAGTQYMEPEEAKPHNRRVSWLITAIAMGAAGIIVFLLTQDTSYLMVLLDRWTVVNVAILAVEIVGYNLAFKRAKHSGYSDIESEEIVS